jgi:hypothetical protein
MGLIYFFTFKEPTPYYTPFLAFCQVPWDNKKPPVLGLIYKSYLSDFNQQDADDT